MSKVFITGHNGAIGSKLKNQLLANGNEVIVPKNGLRLNDEDFFNCALNTQIDVFYHLAAKSFVPDSWDDPIGFYETNVLGTGKVLEFCRSRNVPLVFVSSYVYGAPQYLPINEVHPIQTPNPYSLSKVHAENLIQFYGKNYGVQYNIIRPFNIYGSLQNKKMLIPEIIEQLNSKNEIVVKDLNPRRDQLHIDDLVRLLEMAKGEFFNDCFNAGSGVSYSVAEIIEACQKEWGTSLKVSDTSEARKNEINETICDFSKAKKAFGWTPKISLNEGIGLIKSNYKN
ncbi:NAD(P)-dependent oxidoreductase [Paracrocinitomix mangrovi]|uniref:NAD-dependent epimerase/dehydratase family protein n=1 Tax=Paracrocinitomix mangrovi TaxID=2862509 RepID=UPI001C8EA06B|nr:NAD(P)-dependent oxidoreductase [Paracrocinitomix mangrovi]UKN01567.1 NAD(P)-dependent oxidoreductase [Paracrocinitomix mangrovi]